MRLILSLVLVTEAHSSGGGGAGAFAPPPADLLGVPRDSVEVMLKGIAVNQVIEDERGTLWAATLDRGLAHRERTGKDWAFLTRSDGVLPEESVQRVAWFRGALWVGFPTSGVARLEGTRLQRFTSAQGQLPGDEISDLLEWKGRLWILTDRGLASTDGTSILPVAAGGPGFPHGRITAIAAGDDGKLWAGTDETEVCSFDGALWSTRSFKGRVVARIIRCVHGAAEDYWFGTMGSLDRYWPGTDQLHDETNERPALFPNRVVIAIARLGGDFLIGTGGGGLYRLDLANKTWRLYTETNGLPSAMVNAIFVKNKQALVATSGGVARIDLTLPIPAPSPGPTSASTSPSGSSSPRPPVSAPTSPLPSPSRQSVP